MPTSIHFHKLDAKNLFIRDSELRNGNKGSYTVGIITFRPYRRYSIFRNATQISNIVWQGNNASVAFLHRDDNKTNGQVACIYKIKEKTTATFIPKDMLPNMFIVNELGLEISSDGGVFFGLRHKHGTLPPDNENVEIWNGNDPWIYPKDKAFGNFRDLLKLGYWNPENNKFMVLNDSLQSYITLSGKQEYAVMWSPKQYGPDIKKYNDTDYYAVQLKTGIKKLIVAHQSGAPGQFLILAGTNLLVYYRDEHWWLYDLETNQHINLTESIDTIWDTSDDTSSMEIAPYGCPGWSRDKKSILLYDATDIWSVSLDGKSSKRMTRGREKGIIFRIHETPRKEKIRNYDGVNIPGIDLSNGVVLTAKGISNRASGYFSWTTQKGEVPLAYNDSRIDQISNSSSVCSFIEQTYSTPPQLVSQTKDNKQSVTLYSSNRQQNKYNWGKSALVYYSLPNGAQLKGALFYPANFNPEKQYPMIVHIYQVLSGELNTYVNPSLYNEDGFNSTNYTLDDYFVFYPDITYEMGNPGISATRCVMAAVEKVIGMGNVYRNKIGLIGHSFGGYETNFIITQTDMFAAAVSGAGIADTVGLYFDIGNDFIGPQIWRFEHQQFRMQKSFYENKQGYIRNSPLINADGITTPILLWAGKEDLAVPWKQSMVFYNALRRLGKKNTMLLYPAEGHALSQKENQADLTTRIKQWFDFYLKDIPAKDGVN